MKIVSRIMQTFDSKVTQFTKRSDNDDYCIMASTGSTFLRLGVKKFATILQCGTGRSVHIAKSCLKHYRPNMMNLTTRHFGTSPKLLSASVQNPAPDFQGVAVVDGQFKNISLADFKGKYLVLFFYPLDFTFVCPTEIIAFSDNIKRFHDLNSEVIGVSTDSHFSHLAWINTPRKQGGLGGLKYPLLADFKKEISREYGVLLEDTGVALRGLFLIDPEGIVRQITINDLPVGRSVDETIRLIQAFQFVEKHGEVCPANWKPDDATIKPSPTESKEYFEKVNVN